MVIWRLLTFLSASVQKKLPQFLVPPLLQVHILWNIWTLPQDIISVEKQRFDTIEQLDNVNRRRDNVNLSVSESCYLLC